MLLIVSVLLLFLLLLLLLLSFSCLSFSSCFVTFHLELHITKLIAVRYKFNLFITYKMGLFRPRML